MPSPLGDKPWCTRYTVLSQCGVLRVGLVTLMTVADSYRGVAVEAA